MASKATCLAGLLDQRIVGCVLGRVLGDGLQQQWVPGQPLHRCDQEGAEGQSARQSMGAELPHVQRKIILPTSGVRDTVLCCDNEKKRNNCRF